MFQFTWLLDIIVAQGEYLQIVQMVQSFNLGNSVLKQAQIGELCEIGETLDLFDSVK